MKDDTISRQAAIKSIQECADVAHDNYEWDVEEGYLNSIDCIEALPTAQPDKWEDTVYRKAVQMLLAYFVPDERYAEAVDGLRRLPSVTPKQPGWIPWDSGKFPEESGTYTVTAYDGATRRVTYAKYQKRLKRWELTGARAYWRVLAWMPLPTPYRDGGQDEQN